MRFDNSQLQTALEEWRGSPDARERACADNIWFEERVSLARKAVFEAFAQNVESSAALAEAQNDYWKRFVRVDEDVPHTFLRKLDPSDLGPIDEGQSIIRLEGLAHALSEFQIPFSRLEKAVQKKHDPEERALIASFLGVWNDVRDWRPAFAVFYDEVKEDLDKGDWPNRMRDRLGLAHYSSDKPIPVAIMKYTVKEVNKVHNTSIAHCSFTAPTVFDSAPSPYFFPAPENLNAGRTMAMFEIVDDSHLMSEFLHFRVSYKCDHLFKLGQITERPPNCPLTSLRNDHLMALLIASGRSNFGEEIV